MTPWFFLSYERKDSRRERDVREFFDDLCSEIKDKVEYEEETPVGIIDQSSNKPGDFWPESLHQSVSTSRVFVSLMTHNYFRREFCGKEWGAFEARCHEFQQQHQLDSPPPLMLGVPWVFPKDGDFPSYVLNRHLSIDPAAERGEQIEYVNDYNEKGLYYVFRRKKSTHINAYFSVLEQLSDAIIDKALKYSLPPGRTDDLRNVPNRFAHEIAADAELRKDRLQGIESLFSQHPTHPLEDSVYHRPPQLRIQSLSPMSATAAL